MIIVATRQQMRKYEDLTQFNIADAQVVVSDSSRIISVWQSAKNPVVDDRFKAAQNLALSHAIAKPHQTDAN